MDWIDTAPMFVRVLVALGVTVVSAFVLGVMFWLIAWFLGRAVGDPVWGPRDPHR